MTDRIATIADLEAVVGKTPPTMHLKVIDHLDEGALRWIASSPLMIAGFGDRSGVQVTLGGGSPGFARGDARTLRLPIAALDDPELARPGMAAGSLFLSPGLGETLRVNGKVAGVEADAVIIAVEECYGHCAKALIRSEFWSAAPLSAAPDELAEFAAASRFMALATISREDHADLSPKGDPAGRMALMDDDALWFADRPGNRRVDSFRNIIEQPRVAAALLIPGSALVLILCGQAELTTDLVARQRFEVQDKVPLLACRVQARTARLRVSPALERANLWPVRGQTDIDPAKLFVEHIKLNKAGGISAMLARASLSAPGVADLLKKGLEKDYKDNLY